MFVVVSVQEGLLYSDHFCYATTVVRNLIAVADFYTVAAIALSRTIGILREREIEVATNMLILVSPVQCFSLTHMARKMGSRLRDLAMSLELK